jgi:hypothetical protein
MSPAAVDVSRSQLLPAAVRRLTLGITGHQPKLLFVYECERIAGPKFRNTEYLRIEGDKVKEVEVYFGSLPEAILGK